MTSVLQSQHEHYAEVRRRLFSGSMPVEPTRRWVEPREQPHRPDLPPPALPYIRPMPPKAVGPNKRPRDYILVATPDFLMEVPARQIMRECCSKYEITMQEMLGPKRFVTIVRARQEAAFRMSKETQLSLPQIARKLHKDHTTILHAIRRHAARLEGQEYRKPKHRQEATKSATTGDVSWR